MVIYAQRVVKIGEQSPFGPSLLWNLSQSSQKDLGWPNELSFISNFIHFIPDTSGAPPPTSIRLPV